MEIERKELPKVSNSISLIHVLADDCVQVHDCVVCGCGYVGVVMNYFVPLCPFAGKFRATKTHL